MYTLNCDLRFFQGQKMRQKIMYTPIHAGWHGDTLSIQLAKLVMNFEVHSAKNLAAYANRAAPWLLRQTLRSLESDITSATEFFLDSITFI